MGAARIVVWCPSPGVGRFIAFAGGRGCWVGVGVLKVEGASQAVSGGVVVWK